MVICFDAGNSDLVAGLFSEDKLVKVCRIDYEKEQTKEQYFQLLKDSMSAENIDTDQIDGCLLCCVAQDTAYALCCAMEMVFGCRPVIFKNDENCRLNILTEDPYEVGADIIAY